MHTHPINHSEKVGGIKELDMLYTSNYKLRDRSNGRKEGFWSSIESLAFQVARINMHICVVEIVIRAIGLMLCDVPGDMGTVHQSSEGSHSH